MRTALLLIAIVLLVGGCAYWLWMPEEEVAAAPGPATVHITYTDSGFEPREVTLRKGEAVEWINASSRDMWPAAAVHPTHSIYPEKSEDDCLGSSFDACENLPPGSRWIFTFRDTGDWRFHDHIQPAATGIVHVLE